MNKFKSLHLLGTLIVLSPAILISIAFVIYILRNETETAELNTPVEVVKVDTVYVVKEVPAPTPPAPKPTPVVPPVVKKPAPAPAAPVVKDTVKIQPAPADTIK